MIFLLVSSSLLMLLLRNDILSFRHCLSWVTKKKRKKGARREATTIFFHFHNFSSFNAVKDWMEAKKKSSAATSLKRFHFVFDGFDEEFFSSPSFDCHKRSQSNYIHAFTQSPSSPGRVIFPRQQCALFSWINLSSSHRKAFSTHCQSQRAVEGRITANHIPECLRELF